MKDEVVLGDYVPLFAKRGRSGVCLMFFKLIGVIFLAGAICYLFISNFNAWTPKGGKFSLSLEKQDAFNMRPLIKESTVKEQQLKKEICDLSVGEWIPNPSGPTYTHETCNHIPDYLNCLKNGRPDTGYLHWRWKPNACDLPPFDPQKFLNAMRNKSIAFLGASICHNFVVSLVCQLSTVEEAQDIYHDRSTFHSRTWYYPSYNLTLYVIWAPYLIHYEIIDNKGEASQIDTHLHLDILDSKWTSEYNKYDNVVIAGSPHIFKSSIIYENNQIIGCHNCPQMKLEKFATHKLYRKALQLSLNFIATSKHKPFVIFRAWSPNHSEDGELPNEKVCNKTRPFREEEISGGHGLIMREVEEEEFEKAAAIGAGNGVRMKLLDSYHLSLLRPDGHPGPYCTYHPFDGDKKTKVQNDCMHWCLPGPIDTWNELLLEILINEDAGDFVSALL